MPEAPEQDFEQDSDQEGIPEDTQNADTRERLVTGPWNDAQELQRNHPQTFEAPAEDYLRTLRVGHYVKLGFQVGQVRERIWARIESLEVLRDLVTTSTFRGRLVVESLQMPAMFPANGLVEFEGRHVYDLCDPATADAEELAELTMPSAAPAV